MVNPAAAGSVPQQQLPSGLSIGPAPTGPVQFTIAQAAGADQVPEGEIFLKRDIRPLPGGLDNTLVFNSNSPEVVKQPGVLLSTFPSEGKGDPSAHLDHLMPAGKFDVFLHNILVGADAEDQRTLYVGTLLHNPTDKPITVHVTRSSSYTTQPDAPFAPLPPVVDNPAGKIYSGPGSRVADDFQQSQKSLHWPEKVVIPPGESKMLNSLPISIQGLNVNGKPGVNGFSGLARLVTDGPLYMASLADFAKTNAQGQERSPTLAEWQNLLQESSLAGPRDKAPTPPGAKGAFRYGRVAGVQKGATWNGLVADPGSNALQIPNSGEAISYPLVTLQNRTFGQPIQTAPLLKRYPDTAYSAHGNYGVQYDLKIPLRNTTSETQTVSLAIETPLGSNKDEGGLRFSEDELKATFFRGSVRITYQDDQGIQRTRNVHLVQKKGQQGEDLVSIKIPPNATRAAKVEFVYPADASAPHVLTVKTK